MYRTSHKAKHMMPSSASLVRCHLAMSLTGMLSITLPRQGCLALTCRRLDPAETWLGHMGCARAPRRVLRAAQKYIPSWREGVQLLASQ